MGAYSMDSCVCVRCQTHTHTTVWKGYEMYFKVQYKNNRQNEKKTHVQGESRVKAK